MNSKFTKMCNYDFMSDVIKRVMVDLRAVGETQGPGGKYFFLESQYGNQKITKDGNSVVEQMSYKGELEGPIFKYFQGIVKQVTGIVGDGSTTVAVMMAELFLFLDKLRNSGTNILDIQYGIDFIKPLIFKYLDLVSRKIDLNSKEIEQVATISANGDVLVGKTIAEAMRIVGAEGVITVEESKSSECISYEHKSGMHLDRGFVSPYFATNSEKMICEMEDPYILITSKKISNISLILPLLESSNKQGRPLFIISEDVEGEALSTLILNKLRGTIKVCAIKAPGFGDKRTEMLKDIAVLTGGSVVCDETGEKLEEITIESDFIGSAKRVTVTKDSAVIVSGAGSSEDISSRIAFIKNQINDCTSEYDREKFQERLAKLSGGVAVIKVGGHTEVQIKELKDRVEDALNATRAAAEEGIVPGGGVTQLAISYILHKVINENETLSHDSKIVANKVLEAFSSTIYRIIDNTGKSAKVVINELTKYFDKICLSESNLKIDKVYNALTHEYVNPYDAGIVDPKKVIRVAFEKAVNAIYMILRCEGAVFYQHEEKSDMPSMPGMGGMGGMDGMY